MSISTDVQIKNIENLIVGECKICKAYPEKGILKGWEKPNEPCICLRKFRVARRLLKFHNFPSQHLKVPSELAFAEVVKKQDKEIIQKFKKNIKKAIGCGLSFFFYGSNGIGKTTSAVKLIEDICFYFGQKGSYEPEVNYWFSTASDVFNMYFNDKKEFERVKNVTILLVDDFGKETFGVDSSENANKQYLRIYDELIRHRSNNSLTTIFTTNIMKENLPDFFDKSIMSLIGIQKIGRGGIESRGKYRFIYFKGTDKRPEYEDEWDNL